MFSYLLAGLIKSSNKAPSRKWVNSDEPVRPEEFIIPPSPIINSINTKTIKDFWTKINFFHLRFLHSISSSLVDQNFQTSFDHKYLNASMNFESENSSFSAISVVFTEFSL